MSEQTDGIDYETAPLTTCFSEAWGVIVGPEVAEAIDDAIAKMILPFDVVADDQGNFYVPRNASGHDGSWIRLVHPPTHDEIERSLSDHV